MLIRREFNRQCYEMLREGSNTASADKKKPHCCILSKISQMKKGPIFIIPIFKMRVTT